MPSSISMSTMQLFLLFQVLKRSGRPVDVLPKNFSKSLQFYGHHNPMGYISGNQDRSRFISIASGDVSLGEDQKLAGWTRVIPVPGEKAYQRLALLHAFNFGVPGIPVVYYGDEYGLHGGGDPRQPQDDAIRWVH